MTEIPEHLLKRSRERRAALGLGGDDAGGEAAAPKSTDVTPAAAAAPAEAPAATGPARRGAAPAPAAPPPPKPLHPTVIAAQRRRRIPFWAMAALSLLPIWVFMYARAVTETAEAAEGPLGLGGEVYGNCASCHGGTGGGGSGPAFADGEVLLTFPNIEDQIRFVYYGTSGYNIAGVQSYGDPDRPGGERITGSLGPMPEQGATAGGDLTDYQLLAVVCHERYTLGGADPTSAEWADEYDQWCSEDSEIFSGLESGELGLTTLEDAIEGIIPIGTEPAPGSPAGGS